MKISRWFCRFQSSRFRHVLARTNWVHTSVPWNELWLSRLRAPGVRFVFTRMLVFLRWQMQFYEMSVHKRQTWYVFICFPMHGTVRFSHTYDDLSLIIFSCSIIFICSRWKVALSLAYCFSSYKLHMKIRVERSVVKLSNSRLAICLASFLVFVPRNTIAHFWFIAAFARVPWVELVEKKRKKRWTRTGCEASVGHKFGVRFLSRDQLSLLWRWIVRGERREEMRGAGQVRGKMNCRNGNGSTGRAAQAQPWP